MDRLGKEPWTIARPTPDLLKLQMVFSGFTLIDPLRETRYIPMGLIEDIDIYTRTQSTLWRIDKKLEALKAPDCLGKLIWLGIKTLTGW